MTKSASILVVSSGALCRNPRVLKEATTLGAAGFDVTVLTLAESVAFEDQDRALLARAPFGKIALGSPGQRRWPHLHGFTRRGLSWLARKAVPWGIQSPLALGPARALARCTRSFPADLTIVHNELPHWVGSQLLGAGRRIAADIEDWHSEDLDEADRAYRPLKVLRASEAELLRRAHYCSTTSHALADALTNRYGGPRPMVLTNSFPLQPGPRSGISALPAFFWFSQTIGPGRGLEAFADAWGRTTQPSRLVLLGNARPGLVEDLLRRLPIEKRTMIQIRPLVSPPDLPGTIAEHDIGLALESTQPANKNLTISNKILQYLNAGLAVIASDTAGQREVFAHAPGAGLLVNLADTPALTAGLDALLRDRPRLAAMSRAARSAAEKVYCWENEAPRLLRAVESALSAATTHDRRST